MDPKVCHHCEYPLSDTQSRCPECGTPWVSRPLSRREARNRWLAGGLFFALQIVAVAGVVLANRHLRSFDPESVTREVALCAIMTFACTSFTAAVGFCVSTYPLVGVRVVVIIQALIISLPLNLGLALALRFVLF